MGRENPIHTVTVASFAFTGDPGDFQTSDDKIETGLQSATHWDALAHAGYDDLLYNDTPSAAITMEAGATRLGIENFGPIVTRALVCDVARLKGVDWFDEPYAITGDDLEACLSGAGLQVVPGDVVLVRTGQLHWLREGDRLRYADISPGVGVGAIEWLHDSDVAAIANGHAHVRAVSGRVGREPVPVPGPHDQPARHRHAAGPAVGARRPRRGLCRRRRVRVPARSATPLPVTGGVGGLVAPTAAK